MRMGKLDIASLSQQVDLLDGILVLRPIAKKMFELSQTALGGLMSDDIVICDLKGIIDCSSSFVDEFLLTWQRVICELKNTMMILTNMSEDVQYTVESALNQRNRISNENLTLVVYVKSRIVAMSFCEPRR